MTKPKKIDDIGFGRSPEQNELLKRVFRGMEFRDATANMIVHVKDEDIDGAIPNDVEHCVFARTCSRMFDSTVMVFFARTAYVDIEDEDGVRRALRFAISEKMHKAIKALDEKGKPAPGTFILRAPSSSNRLNKHRRESAKRRKDPGHRKRHADYQKRRSALIKTTGRRVKTLSQAGVLGVVRSGTGLVQTKVVKVDHVV